MILVAGNANLQTTVPVPGFPLAYAPVRYPIRQIRSQVSGVGFLLAAALARLGHEVGLAAMVGDDPAGHAVRAAAQAAGIDTTGLAETRETPLGVVLVAPDGQRSVHTDLKDVQEATYPPEPFAKLLAGTELAVLTNIGWCRPLLELATRAHVPIATDVQAISDPDDAYNTDWMRAATILACSHERLPIPPDDWAQTVMGRYGCRVHLVGLGADGCLLAQRAHPEATVDVGRVPAVAPRGVTDTTGAGDALLAGFLDGWIRGHTPQQATIRGVTLAGWKVGGGAWLTADELNALAASAFYPEGR